jgi:hypothetical protein
MALLFAAVLAASLIADAPKKLPSVALGWGLLFHVQRAAAVLATLGATALVAWKAAHREFPVKFGQLEYPAKEVDATAADAIAGLNERVADIEDVLGIGPPGG